MGAIAKRCITKARHSKAHHGKSRQSKSAPWQSTHSKSEGVGTPPLLEALKTGALGKRNSLFRQANDIQNAQVNGYETVDSLKPK